MRIEDTWYRHSNGTGTADDPTQYSVMIACLPTHLYSLGHQTAELSPSVNVIGGSRTVIWGSKLKNARNVSQTKELVFPFLTLW